MLYILHTYYDEKYVMYYTYIIYDTYYIYTYIYIG